MRSYFEERIVGGRFRADDPPITNHFGFPEARFLGQNSSQSTTVEETGYRPLACIIPTKNNPTPLKLEFREVVISKMVIATTTRQSWGHGVPFDIRTRNPERCVQGGSRGIPVERCCQGILICFFVQARKSARIGLFVLRIRSKACPRNIHQYSRWVIATRGSLERARIVWYEARWHPKPLIDASRGDA